MEHINAALLTRYRDDSQDLAFSALPNAPRRPDTPGPVRRSLSRSLLRTAHWLEPGVTARPAAVSHTALAHQPQH